MGARRHNWDHIALSVKADLHTTLQMKIAGENQAGVLLTHLQASARRSTANQMALKIGAQIGSVARQQRPQIRSK